MSYIVLFTTTKEASTPWFHDIDPDTVNAINQFIKTQPGFVSVRKTTDSDTRIVKVYTFDTKENYDAFIAAFDTNTSQMARQAYNDANNIITTRQQI